MSLLGKCVWMSVASCTLLLGGCLGDPGQLVKQEYVLQVTEVSSGNPVPNATVVSWPEDRRAIVESDDDYLDQVQQNEGSSTTDESGRVVLTLSSGILCGGGKCDNPAYLDQVLGQVFLVRVETGAASEILHVEVTPDNSVSGELFSVAVLSIGDPK